MTTIHHYDDITWHVPPSDPKDLDLATPPNDGEAGRKFLIQGESGFYLQTVKIPANFDAPVHSHDHAEIFMVVAGDCIFNGEAMRPLDCTVVAANEPYGFKSGPDGVQFLVTRNGVAKFFERS
jgi:quercetin dioxygenase-like cupin family protein